MDKNAPTNTLKIGGRFKQVVDYLGAPERLAQVRAVVTREVAAALRVAAAQVTVRRMPTEDERDEVELWVELSTDEQLYRLGRQLAQRISAGLRPDDSSGGGASCDSGDRVGLGQ